MTPCLRLQLWLLVGESDATLIAVLEALLMFSRSKPDSSCPTRSISESLVSPQSQSTLTSMLSAPKDCQFVCSEIVSCGATNSFPRSLGMEVYMRLQPLLVVVLAPSLLEPGLQWWKLELKVILRTLSLFLVLVRRHAKQLRKKFLKFASAPKTIPLLCQFWRALTLRTRSIVSLCPKWWRMNASGTSTQFRIPLASTLLSLLPLLANRKNLWVIWRSALGLWERTPLWTTTQQRPPTGWLPRSQIPLS
jgi:hypothetical protein